MAARQLPGRKTFHKTWRAVGSDFLVCIREVSCDSGACTIVALKRIKSWLLLRLHGSANCNETASARSDQEQTWSIAEWLARLMGEMFLRNASMHLLE